MTTTKFVTIGIFIVFSALTLSLFQNCENKSLNLGSQPSDETCPNGATNPPLCNNGSQSYCTNGATNYPYCDDIQNTCDNGAINFPLCNDFNNNNEDIYMVVTSSKSGTESLDVVSSSNTHYLKIYNASPSLRACAHLTGGTGCIVNSAVQYFPMDNGCSYGNGSNESGEPYIFCNTEPNTTSTYYNTYSFNRVASDGIADQSDYDTVNDSTWKFNKPELPHYDSSIEDNVWWKKVDPMELNDNLSITLYFKNPISEKNGNFTYTILK